MLPPNLKVWRPFTIDRSSTKLCVLMSRPLVMSVASSNARSSRKRKRVDVPVTQAERVGVDAREAVAEGVHQVAADGRVPPERPAPVLVAARAARRRAGILRRAVDGVVLLVEAAEEVVAAVQAIVAAGDVGAERVLDRRGEAEVVDVAGIPPVLVRRRELPEVAHRRGVRPDVQRIDPGQFRRGEAVRAGRHAVRAGRRRGRCRPGRPRASRTGRSGRRRAASRTARRG